MKPLTLALYEPMVETQDPPIHLYREPSVNQKAIPRVELGPETERAESNHAIINPMMNLRDQIQKLLAVNFAQGDGATLAQAASQLEQLLPTLKDVVPLTSVWQPDPRDPLPPFDIDRFRQVCENAIGNAMKWLDLREQYEKMTA